MQPDDKTNASQRLKRIAGQIAGIQRMLDDDRDCVDVMHQIGAVQAALLETGRVILAGHFESCLTDAFESGDRAQRRKSLDALMDVFARLCRIDEVERRTS